MADDQTSLSSEIRYATFRLDVKSKKGSAVGSAFLYEHTDSEGRTLPLLVSNKHVLDDFEVIMCTVRGSKDGSIDLIENLNISIPRSECQYFRHPQDDVDLAAIPFGPAFHGLVDRNLQPFMRSFGRELIPSQEVLDSLSAVEEILLIGYPNGLWDSENNLPIMRRGITATHCGTDFQGMKEFLIDCACFPGSSGSPVVLLNEGGYSHAGGFTVGNRFHFLGVLHAGPMISNEGRITIEPVPTATDARIEVASTMHLGYVLRSERVRELAQHVEKTLQH